MLYNNLVFKLKTLIKLFRNDNSINGISKKIYKYVNHKDGFYIECGAFDGVNQSNTWFFEKTLNWKGVLIEPNPITYKKLIAYRSKRNFFHNEIVANEVSKNKLSITNDGLYSKVTKDNFFYSRTTGQPIYEKIISKNNTLYNILESNNLLKQKIDFFSLDVEGHELDVIKSLGKLINNVNFFLIETDHFDRIDVYMVNNKFKFLEKLSKNDYLYQNIKY